MYMPTVGGDRVRTTSLVWAPIRALEMVQKQRILIQLLALSAHRLAYLHTTPALALWPSIGRPLESATQRRGSTACGPLASPPFVIRVAVPPPLVGIHDCCHVRRQRCCSGQRPDHL